MNFFEKFFVYPTVHLTGYNAVNTIIYSIIFVLTAYFLYVFIERKKIKIDSKFVESALPFAIFGVIYRLQVDYNVFSPSFYTVTPGCWIIAFVPWLTILAISNKDRYYKNSLVLGGIILILSLLIFKINIGNYLVTILYVILLSLVIETLMIENFYLLAFIGEYTDAVSSYIGIKIGMYEEHVVSRVLIHLSPEIYFIAKLLVTASILLLIYKLSIPENLKKYICSVIFILGFGPGSRNWLLLAR